MLKLSLGGTFNFPLLSSLGDAVSGTSVISLLPKSVKSVKQTRFFCTECGKYFHNRSNLHRHNKTVHFPVPQIYICPIDGCSSHLSRSDTLNHHMRHVHKMILDNPLNANK